MRRGWVNGSAWLYGVHGVNSTSLQMNLMDLNQHDILLWQDNNRQQQRFACDRCHDKKVRCSGPPGACDRCVNHNVPCETTRRLRRAEIAKTLGKRIKELELMVAQKQGPEALRGSHLIYRHDLLHTYFEHINAQWPLFESQSFSDSLHQQSAFLLYAIYANSERLLHGTSEGQAATFFQLARQMVQSQLKGMYFD